ncbi:CIA30 family protein [Lacimicrobium sp. SS2-24]|uniref:CIA30 family protein n=1 Tax=Lacimicrobium sp. SS2-24 TaxID=2005569 RepID=UPI0014387E2D|nr:CIA30 family protein [Lacimicrobium sp. SS2-24]
MTSGTAAMNKDRTPGQSLVLSEGWMRVNDSVMGGISTSRAYMEDDVLHFEGQLSLANNGGFVSLQRPVPEEVFSGSTDLCLNFKLEPGRQLQVRLRDGRGSDGVAYRQSITASGDWQRVQLDIGDFIPVFRGRVLTGYPGVEQTIAPRNIRQVGLLISDKNTTPFHLLVNEMSACTIH